MIGHVSYGKLGVEACACISTRHGLSWPHNTTLAGPRSTPSSTDTLQRLTPRHSTWPGTLPGHPGMPGGMLGGMPGGMPDVYPPCRTAHNSQPVCTTCGYVNDAEPHGTRAHTWYARCCGCDGSCGCGGALGRAA